MELKIKTSELQDMVSKSIKCVSNNKLIPLTSLMNIKVKGNILTLTTTDATNYLYVSNPNKLDCEDFEVSVLADTFTKLVQKTTSEVTTLSLEAGFLKISGNGTYNMELPLDENGSIIKFPSKISDDFRTQAGVVKLSTIKNILTLNKPSLAVNMEFPALTTYYCGDSVITSDRKKVCKTDIKVFDTPMLITPALMELLGALTNEDIEVTTTENDIVFRTTTDCIYAPITEGLETFPVAAIENLVSQEFKSVCTVSTAAILNVIDRLSLFVAPYDKHAIYLTFNNEGIMFSSKKSNGTELIPYTTSNDYAPYTCCVNIEMLRSQIAGHSCDNLEIAYGSEVTLKFVDKNVTQLLALLQDDRMEG